MSELESKESSPKNGAAAHALIDGGSIRGVSPRDGSPLDPVSCTPIEELDAIVARVRRASTQHAERDLETRASLLRKFKDAILRRGDALSDTLMAECGKPEPETWLHEIVPTADLSAYWSTEGPELLLSEEPHLDPTSYPGKRAVVERLARGVIGLITPWNFPVAIPLRTIFPALLAGNGVVLKPSEHAPRCAAMIAEAASEVFGPDLLVVAQGDGQVAQALIGAGIDAVVFTGSVATGRKVAHAAADALIPVSLELGGKDAALVLDDADVERAARGIVWGAFANAGQNCAAIERVYATPKAYEPLKKRLVELVKALEPGRDVGPLSNERQLHVVEEQVKRAVEAGAKVLAGGERLDRPGFWFAPTLLEAPPSDSAAMVEETFGPMVPIVKVDNEEAGIEAANSGRYGLTASVWTTDIAHGEVVARRLRCGVTMVNNHGFTGAIPSLPWTGVGESGFGVTNSPHALDLLTRPRAVVVDTRRAKSELWWHPYTPGLTALAKQMAALRGGAGVGTKFKAVISLPGAFMGRWKA